MSLDNLLKDIYTKARDDKDHMRFALAIAAWYLVAEWEQSSNVDVRNSKRYQEILGLLQYALKKEDKKT